MLLHRLPRVLKKGKPSAIALKLAGRVAPVADMVALGLVDAGTDRVLLEYQVVHPVECRSGRFLNRSFS